jgi:adenine-specific DNA-methyltransferase
MKCLTYLGNKRKYLHHIWEEVKAVTPDGETVCDLFSGSGVVSYYLREKGYVVHANDIAGYSFPINQSNLAYTPESLHIRADLDTEIARLNALTAPKAGEEYFARYYSENSEATYERLFYTKRNGLFIDAVLNEIHAPGYDAATKDLILSDLLFKMSKHVNTNGHFKTFHKEFGGMTNKHDVERITAPIVLEKPEPPNGPVGKSWCMDAEEMIKTCGVRFNCVYLDPPYNQHQYSANYHLLEAACLPRNKRYVPRDSQVSGINPALYKSPYCSKQKCMKAFASLVETLKPACDSLVVSYNSKGYIPMEAMRATLEKAGVTEMRTLDGHYKIGTRKTGTSAKPDREVSEYLFRVKF